MQVEILNISGKKTAKKADLIDSIFSAEPNDHCIYLDVKQFLANQRQGTHKSKERAEISRTTKKIKKTKRNWWSSSRFNEIAIIHWWRSCFWS